MSEFEIFVCKADFKFNCAHFIAYKGFRERLHGHNYHVSVKVTGTGDVGEEGYLIDFGDIKKATRFLCSSMNEYFICPMRSDVMYIDIESEPSQLIISCEDGAHFSFPQKDCKMLPLVHSSAEELAHYFWCQIIRRIGLKDLLARGINVLEVGIAEAIGQEAIFRSPLPADETSLLEFEVLKIRRKPTPCFEDV